MDKPLKLKLATPCKADWSKMKGDDRVRFCAQCQKNVYNLSALTTAQARELVNAKEARPCVSFFQRRDGTVLTADCPVGVSAARRSLAFALTLVASILVLPGLFIVPSGGNVKFDWAKVAEKGRALPVLGPLINRIAPRPPPPSPVMPMRLGGFANTSTNDY